MAAPGRGIGMTAAAAAAPMRRPKLMGILNLTPDSFSGDGTLQPQRAFALAERMVRLGASLIDVGAESTRPGADAIGPLEERRRLAPVLQRIVAAPWRRRISISIDTRHPATAQWCLALGVDVLNDVSGLTDPDMLEVAARGACPVIAMHAARIPADPRVKLPQHADVVETVRAWREEVIERATRGGVARDRLIFDPGFGFGKSTRQTLDLILRARELTALGGTWVFGHSRKSMLAPSSYRSMRQRDDHTLLVSGLLALSGVDILRVHDVRAHALLLASLLD
ncbi:MAG: dihydropteroate synthase [Rubrivivax sp. SCN 71-131]|jgi:dihydropteroate synthase|nr:MAG: dihydropteroate synthase [Rubrivivax sp. SCN 71-131]